MNIKEVNKFVKLQQSIQFYKNVQKALKNVLMAIPEDEYNKLTKNLILMVLHQEALGQVMHFSKPNGKFKVLQLTIHNKMPISVLRYVIAHELGHVAQGRNWKKSDGQKLEVDADKTAARWGFVKTKSIAKWMKHDK